MVLRINLGTSRVGLELLSDNGAIVARVYEKFSISRHRHARKPAAKFPDSTEQVLRSAIVRNGWYRRAPVPQIRETLCSPPMLLSQDKKEMSACCGWGRKATLPVLAA